MGVRISVLLVVNGKIGAHSNGHKIFFHIFPYKLYLLFPVKFYGQGNFNLPCKL